MGWDVVLSADEKLPVCLLEVNLVSYIGLFFLMLRSNSKQRSQYFVLQSCNFFRGTFDRKVYLDFLEDMVMKLQDMRLIADKQGKKFKSA